MTALEKLCENEYIKNPLEFANGNCPERAGINLGRPLTCQLECEIFGGLEMTRDNNIRCLKCWLREVVD